MKTPNKLILANLRQNKKRTRATLLAVILSCTLLFAVGIAFSSYMQNSINESAKAEGSYHVLYYDVDYQKSKDYLENNKKIQDIYIMQQISKFERDERVFQVLSYSDDLNPEINISEGREPNNDKEILISKQSLNNLELNINDKFEGYNIVGIYDNNYVLEEYPIGDGFIKRNPTITFVTKKETDTSNEHSCFFITYKNIKKTYEYMEEDAKGLNLKDTIVANVQANKEYLKTNGVGQDSFNYAMRYLALALTLYFISVFCMLIIYNAFAISLTERKKQFGILRSLGTSKKTIIGMITKELLILSLIAFPISFVLGNLLVLGGLKVLDVLLNIHIPLSYNILTFLITIFFVIFSMVLSAYTPGRKASKTSPMEAIKSTKEYKIKKSNREYRLTKKIFGPEGQLARKNLKRNGRQFGTVTTSLTISVILFILVSTIINFLTLEMRELEIDYGDYNSKIVIQVHYKDKKDIDNFFTDLKKISYIDSKTILRSTWVYLSDDNPYYTEDATNKYSKNALILGLEKDTYNQFAKANHLTSGKIFFNNYYQEFEDDEPYKIFKEDASIIICKTNRDENNNLIRETCDLELSNIEFIDKVVGIGNLNPEDWGSVIFMEDNEYEQYVQNYPEHLRIDKYSKYYNIEIQSEQYKEFDKEFVELIDKYKDLDINYQNYPLNEYLDKRKILFIELIIYAVIFFIGLISIVGMLNSINTNLNLREREFAMLRSMGYSKKSLNKMISLENIFLVSKSFISALIITLVGFLALNQMFSYDNITNEFIFPPKINIPYPWAYTIIAFIAVILLILFLTSFSIKKIKNQNIIEAIRKYSI